MDRIKMKTAILDALKARYEAQILEADATLKIYFESSVGVGEHPKIIEDIIELVHKASEAQDSIEMLDKIMENEK